MKEFNEFTFNNNNTEYLSDLHSKGIIEPKIENGVVNIIVSPITERLNIISNTPQNTEINKKRNNLFLRYILKDNRKM